MKSLSSSMLILCLLSLSLKITAADQSKIQFVALKEGKDFEKLKPIFIESYLAMTDENAREKRRERIEEIFLILKDWPGKNRTRIVVGLNDKQEVIGFFSFRSRDEEEKLIAIHSSPFLSGYENLAYDCWKKTLKKEFPNAKEAFLTCPKDMPVLQKHIEKRGFSKCPDYTGDGSLPKPPEVEIIGYSQKLEKERWLPPSV